MGRIWQGDMKKLPKWLDKLWSATNKDIEERVFSHSYINEEMVKIASEKLRLRDLDNGT